MNKGGRESFHSERGGVICTDGDTVSVELVYCIVEAFPEGMLYCDLLKQEAL
jgi:hypothetical protein